MKKTSLLFLLAFALISATSLRAQVSDCLIKYKVDVSGDDIEPQVKQMMQGASMEMAFKDQASRVKMNMGMMGTTTAVTDRVNQKGVVLMNMMGMNMAMPLTAEDMKPGDAEDSGLKFKLTDKTKEIAGYKCKHAIATDEDGNSYDFWYTNKIMPKSVPSEYKYKGIDGFPLEMFMINNGMKLKMVAESVSTKTLDASMFSTEVPSGYTVMSKDQMRNMGGGR